MLQNDDFPGDLGLGFFLLVWVFFYFLGFFFQYQAALFRAYTQADIPTSAHYLGLMHRLEFGNGFAGPSQAAAAREATVQLTWQRSHVPTISTVFLSPSSSPSHIPRNHILSKAVPNPSEPSLVGAELQRTAPPCCP